MHSGLTRLWQQLRLLPCRHPVSRSLTMSSSASNKHAWGTVEHERPSKRARVDDVDEEGEEGDAPETKQEPQKASDLYLDTVRVTVVYI